MRVIEKEGYILAVITGFLYLRAYLYVLAKANFYGVSIEIMSFDLLQLTHAAIGGLASLVGMAIIPIILYCWIKNGANKPKIFHYLMLAFLLSVMPFFSMLGENKAAALISIALCFIISAVLYFSLRVVSRNKMRLYSVIDELKDLMRLPAVKFSSILLLCAISLSSSYVASYLESYSMKSYNVFFKDEYYAIINASSDNVLAKKISKNSLEDGYYIFKVESLGNVEIKKENINFLTALKTNNSKALAPQ